MNDRSRHVGRCRSSEISKQEVELFDRLVHDLRNPLGVIAYFAEAVASATDVEREELCVRLRVNAQRALHVVDELALLASLRAGSGQAAQERGDLAEIADELATELEIMERRPGRIRRVGALGRPVSVRRLHVAAALRALLRTALRVASADDPVVLDLRAADGQAVISITVPLRADPAIGVTPRLPTRGLEIELAERVAALHGGRYGLELRPGSGVMVFAIAAPG